MQPFLQPPPSPVPGSAWVDRMRDKRITMAHGSGGKAMRELIEQLFVEAFNNPLLGAMEDQAVVPLDRLRQQGSMLAFTTDGYVVNPLFFPAAVSGTWQ